VVAITVIRLFIWLYIRTYILLPRSWEKQRIHCRQQRRL